jgi:hypothetical protein
MADEKIIKEGNSDIVNLPQFNRRFKKSIEQFSNPSNIFLSNFNIA